jgi:hypothetical protein
MSVLIGVKIQKMVVLIKWFVKFDLICMQIDC